MELGTCGDKEKDLRSKPRRGGGCLRSLSGWGRTAGDRASPLAPQPRSQEAHGEGVGSLWLDSMSVTCRGTAADAPTGAWPLPPSIRAPGAWHGVGTGELGPSLATTPGDTRPAAPRFSVPPADLGPLPLYNLLNLMFGEKGNLEEVSGCYSPLTLAVPPPVRSCSEPINRDTVSISHRAIHCKGRSQALKDISLYLVIRTTNCKQSHSFPITQVCRGI